MSSSGGSSSSKSSSSKSSSSKSTAKTVSKPMTKAVSASKSSSSGTSSGIAGGLSRLGSTSKPTSTASKVLTASKPASTPSSSGTSSGIAGGLSMLGAGSSGSKTSVSSPMTKAVNAAKSSSSGTSSGISGGLSRLGTGSSSVSSPLPDISGGKSLIESAMGSQFGAAVPYAKAAVRALAKGANTLSQQAGTDKIGAGTQLGFNQWLGADTGKPSLNKQADWVGQNVLPLLIPAGGAAKGLSTVAPAAVKAGSGLAARALGTAAGAADDVARAGGGLAQRALQAAKSGASGVASVPRMAATVARNAPTAVKIGVPTLALGGLAVNQALKEGNNPNALTEITNEGQQALRPTLTQSTTATPNTMTPRYGTGAPGGGMSIPGGTGNAMGGPTGQPGQGDTGQFQWPDWMRSMFEQDMQQQQPEEMMIEQPEMPDFEAQQAEMLALIDQIMQQNQAMSLSYLNQMTSQLDQLQNEIIAKYQQQGTELDPATMAALTEIRNEVDRRRQGLMEEMNRRGLLQSGIWLEEENRILSNQLSTEEKLMAGRLAEAQNRIMDTITSFATQRMNIMGSSMQNQMNMMNTTNNLKLNTVASTQDRQNQWDQWWAQQQQAAKSDQFDMGKWLYEQQVKQAEADRQYELDRMQTTYNVGKPYSSPNAGRSSGNNMTATDRKNAAFADAIADVDYAMSKPGANPAQVEANINTYYSDYVRNGVDPAKLIAYLNQQYPAQSNQGSWYTQLDEKLGGWLPFGAGR